MPGVEDLRTAREAMARYREKSLCGTCKEDADAVIDMLDKDIEFEGLMHQYVASGMKHPKATEVPERSRQIGEARDEVKRRLAPADPPRLLQRRPGEAIDMVRSWRTEMGEMVPRPFGILGGTKRGRG